MKIRKIPAGVKFNGYITLILQLIKMFFQFVFMVILTRITPVSDIGQFAISVLIISALDFVRDFGLRLTLLQRDNLPYKELSNAFWISTIWASGIFSIFCVVIITIEIVYQNFSLTIMACFMSTTLILNSLQSQSYTAMAKKQRFIAIGLTDFAAQLVAGLLGILIAFEFGGKKGLMFQFVLASFFLLVFRFMAEEWRPSRLTRNVFKSKLISKSSHLGITQISNWLGNNIDTIVVSKRYNYETVGLYSRSFSLIYVPQLNITETLCNWLLPTLKARSNNGNNNTDKLLFRVQKSYLYCIIPLNLFIFYSSEFVIRYFLGDAWVNIDLFAPAFSLASIVYVNIAFARLIMILSDENKLLMKTTLYTRGVSIVLILMASFSSPEFVAYTFFATSLVTCIFSMAKIPRKVCSHFKLSIYIQNASLGVTFATLVLVEFLRKVVDLEFLEKQSGFVSALLSVTLYQMLMFRKGHER